MDDDILSTGVIIYHLKVCNIGKECRDQQSSTSPEFVPLWMLDWIIWYKGLSTNKWFIAFCWVFQVNMKDNAHPERHNMWQRQIYCIHTCTVLFCDRRERQELVERRPARSRTLVGTACGYGYKGCMSSLYNCKVFRMNIYEWVKKRKKQHMNSSHKKGFNRKGNLCCYPTSLCFQGCAVHVYRGNTVS